MTEGMAQETGQEQEQVGSPVAEEAQGGNELNPAWEELLGVVPEDLHGQVTPHLQKWDQNFDKVQSTYAPYKPFVDNQVPAENIEFALGVMQQIERDPMGVIQSLTKYAQENGLWTEPQGNQSQTPNDQGQVEDDELSQNPRFQELQKKFDEMQQLVQTMGQQLLTERQTETQAQEDAELESELKRLAEEYGEFDEDWVLDRAVKAHEAGGRIDDLAPFVQQYREYEQSIVAKHNRPAPKLLPSGGNPPNSQIDMKNLTPEQRTKLIADRIMAASQQDN